MAALLDRGARGPRRSRALGGGEANRRPDPLRRPLLRTRCPARGRADYRSRPRSATARATATPFPSPGRRGVFDHGEVRIETDGRRGARVAVATPGRGSSAAPACAATCAGTRSTPPTSPATRSGTTSTRRTCSPARTCAHVSSSPGTWAARRWRRLEADFPPGLDTHSPAQVFYFDEGGLLRRHDYVAEVVGGWARAAHCAPGTSRPAGWCSRPALGATARAWQPGAAVPDLVSLGISELEVGSSEPACSGTSPSRTTARRRAGPSPTSASSTNGTP